MTYTVYTAPKYNPTTKMTLSALKVSVNGEEIQGVSDKQVNYAISLMTQKIQNEANDMITRVFMTANQMGGIDKFVEQIAAQSNGTMTTIEQYVAFMVERRVKALKETNAHTVIEMVK